jgi:hypothetical protein
MWKLLRRDLRLDHEQTALAVCELVDALLAQSSPRNAARERNKSKER